MAPRGLITAGYLTAGLVLAGCASVSAPSFSDDAAAPPSVYGAFLAGRYAGQIQDASASARLYTLALKGEPDNGIIAARTLGVALMAGDFERADSAARAAAAAGVDSAGLAFLYLEAAALADGESAPPPQGQAASAFSALIEAMIRDWALLEAGETAAALAGARALDELRDASGHTLIHRALIYEAAGYRAEAEAAYRAAYAAFDAPGFTTTLLGAHLERAGRREEAIALYRRALSRGPADPGLEAALTRAERGRRPPRVLTGSKGAARAIYAPALGLAGGGADVAVLYLRLAERLDPEFARNRMALAELLDEAGYQGEAMAAYRALEGTPFETDAMIDKAWLAYRMGQEAIAIETAEALYARRAGERAALLLADLYNFSGRCAEAVPIYAELLAGGVNGPGAWRLHYYYGVCLQALDDWPAAEAMFLEGIARAPNEPILLNHLGYSWITMDRNFDDGFALIQRAAALDPDNGAIIDSLGWGHYLAGRYEIAVPYLERAAALTSWNAEIVAHLGDAYWRVGRRLEARFQWRHALDLDPSPDERAALERRLEDGLPAPPYDGPPDPDRGA